MKKNILVIVVLLAIGSLTSTKKSFADSVLVPMEQLSWQIAPDGKVYLRNLNSFNATFKGCCYNYWVDTTTPSGKSLWAVMLLKISTAQPLYFILSSAAAGGQIEFAGIGD